VPCLAVLPRAHDQRPTEPESRLQSADRQTESLTESTRPRWPHRGSGPPMVGWTIVAQGWSESSRYRACLSVSLCACCCLFCSSHAVAVAVSIHLIFYSHEYAEGGEKERSSFTQWGRGCSRQGAGKDAIGGWGAFTSWGRPL
jgi:hypothetical protein